MGRAGDEGMFRFFVILIPLLVAVGCTWLVVKLPKTRSEQDRAMRLFGGAFAIGLFFSGVTWWQQTTVADQLAQAQKMAVGQKTQVAWGKAEDKGYEEQIKTLTDQVNSLKAQLANQDKTAQPPLAATAVKQQSAELPKIYWTQDSLSSGQAAIRFKIYGPLNIPAFVAICDRPCRATSGRIGTGSEGTQVVGATTKIAGYVFRNPRPVKAGAEGFLIVEPGSAKVTDFRALGESEIPEGLR
jgi:hypothetical protein